MLERAFLLGGGTIASEQQPTKRTGPEGAALSKKSRKPQLKHDWTQWRDVYVFGDMSIRELAKMPGSPRYQDISVHSSKEGWPRLRAETRERISEKARELASVGVAAVQVRYSKFARGIFNVAVQGLSHIKPETLGDLGVYRMARLAQTMEAFALALEDTYFDPNNFDKGELEEMAGGADPIAIIKKRRRDA